MSGSDKPTSSSTAAPFRLPTINKETFQTPEWGAVVAGLEVGLWNSIGYVAQAVGLETTLASKSAFLCSLAVVTVPVLDWLTGKNLQRRELLGATMALVGVAFLELGGETASDLLQFSKGDIASLIQPLAFGMGFWRMERAMHKFPDQANRSTAAQLLAVFGGSLVYTAVTDLPSLLDVAQVQQWLSDPSLLAALVWTGVMTTAVSVYMETLALKTLSAAETTLIFSTEPVWGSLFAAVAMGETFGWTALTGGALILSGCVFSNLGVDGMRQFFQKKNQKRSSRRKDQHPPHNGSVVPSHIHAYALLTRTHARIHPFLLHRNTPPSHPNPRYVRTYDDVLFQHAPSERNIEAGTIIHQDIETLRLLTCNRSMMNSFPATFYCTTSYKYSKLETYTFAYSACSPYHHYGQIRWYGTINRKR